MKVKALFNFTNKENLKHIEKDTIFECTEERYNELRKAGAVILVKEKTKKAKKENK